MRSRTRRLPLRLTDLESRVTPALSLHGPYTAGELEQLSMTGANAWQVRLALAPATAGAKTYFDLDDFVPARLNVAQVRHHLAARRGCSNQTRRPSSCPCRSPTGRLRDFVCGNTRSWSQGTWTRAPRSGPTADKELTTRTPPCMPMFPHLDSMLRCCHRTGRGMWTRTGTCKRPSTSPTSARICMTITAAGATCASGEPTFTTGSLNPIGGTTLPPTGSGTVTPFSLGKRRHDANVSPGLRCHWRIHGLLRRDRDRRRDGHQGCRQPHESGVLQRAVDPVRPRHQQQ